jgi:ADP-heptose:LPS heptosyltransferase
VLAGFDSHGRFPWLDVALEWDEDVPLRTKHGHVSDDLVALVEALWVHGEPARAATLTPPATTPQSFARLPAALRRRLFAKPLICVHPASGSVMRQWPLAKFAALIDLLAAHDDHQVAVIGGPDETEHAAKLLAGVAARERVIDLVGLTASEELPQLLGRAALFVGNNSGPQHLAAALGIPTIGIHSGVVDAREWGPVGPQAIALRRAMSCSPCFIEHAKDCQRGLACLEELAVDAVYRACLAALGQPEPRWNAGAVEAARV